jgi:hypothetical protein
MNRVHLHALSVRPPGPPRNPFLDIHRESMGTVYDYTHGTTHYYYYYYYYYQYYYILLTRYYFRACVKYIYIYYYTHGRVYNEIKIYMRLYIHIILLLLFITLCCVRVQNNIVRRRRNVFNTTVRAIMLKSSKRTGKRKREIARLTHLLYRYIVPNHRPSFM